MASPQLTPRFTPSARVEELARDPSHYRLTIPSGGADSYRLAQLDDYDAARKTTLPASLPPCPQPVCPYLQRLSPGTWGFGLWNDPFGLSLGFGGKPFRLPALPNAVWFFGASRENYLSFRAERRSKTEDEALLASRASSPASPNSASAQRGIANGFLAQTFRSPRFHPQLIPAGLALPFSRSDNSAAVGQSHCGGWDSIMGSGARPASWSESIRVDPTDWHRYRLEWSLKRVLFEVDEVQVFESSVSPNPPLGLVIWIDNQYAAFTPEGKIGFGVLENPEPAWLEIKEIEVS